jgi:hypothetical protein
MHLETTINANERRYGVGQTQTQKKILADPTTQALTWRISRDQCDVSSSVGGGDIGIKNNARIGLTSACGGL